MITQQRAASGQNWNRVNRNGEVEFEAGQDGNDPIQTEKAISKRNNPTFSGDSLKVFENNVNVSVK